jgi:hypothetical protein
MNDLALDPKPWLFISDQVFGEIRSDHDKGYHDVSGTYWVFSPRCDFEQDRTKYIAEAERESRVAEANNRNRERLDRRTPADLKRMDQREEFLRERALSHHSTGSDYAPPTDISGT